MTMFRTTLPLLWFACLAPAQIIPVSGGGAALQNAIAAAPNAAILVIAPGTYSQVSLSVARDVTLIAPQGASVDRGLFVGTGGTRRLTVVGLTILPVFQYPQITGGTLSTDGHLHAENCVAGAVLAGNASTRSLVYLRSCSFGGVQSTSRMQNVDAVLLDSTFTGYSDAGQVGYPGLIVTGVGSLRAERVHATGGGGSFAGGAGIEVATSAVFADCTLAAGLSPYPTSVYCGGTLTLSNCTLSGPPWPTPILRTVPTASWVTNAWTLGGMSTVRFRESPNELVAVVASLDIAPSTSPLAAETLWIAANPTTFVMSIGVTGTGGDLVALFTIPNVLALQYTKAWLTGAFFDPMPMRTTCPLGGVIR